MHEQGPFTSTSTFADAEPEVRARFRSPCLRDETVMVRMGGSIAAGLFIEVRRTFAVLVSGEAFRDGAGLRVSFGSADPVVGLELRAGKTRRTLAPLQTVDDNAVLTRVEPSETDLTLWATHKSGVQSRVFWGAAEDALVHVDCGVFVRRDDRGCTVVGADVPTLMVSGISAGDAPSRSAACTGAAVPVGSGSQGRGPYPHRVPWCRQESSRSSSPSAQTPGSSA